MWLFFKRLCFRGHSPFDYKDELIGLLVNEHFLNLDFDWLRKKYSLGKIRWCSEWPDLNTFEESGHTAKRSPFGFVSSVSNVFGFDWTSKRVGIGQRLNSFMWWFIKHWTFRLFNKNNLSLNFWSLMFYTGGVMSNKFLYSYVLHVIVLGIIGYIHLHQRAESLRVTRYDF